MLERQPQEGDKYIYKNGIPLPSGSIAYYLNHERNIFYLYGIGDDNKIIYNLTGNKNFNRYKIFYDTNEGKNFGGADFEGLEKQSETKSKK